MVYLLESIYLILFQILPSYQVVKMYESLLMIRIVFDKCKHIRNFTSARLIRRLSKY